MGTVSRLAGRLATPREPECQSDNLSDSCLRQACRRPILEADQDATQPAGRPVQDRRTLSGSVTFGEVVAGYPGLQAYLDKNQRSDATHAACGGRVAGIRQIRPPLPRRNPGLAPGFPLVCYFSTPRR